MDRFMNVSETDIQLKKLKVFKNNDDIIMDSIKNEFIKINNCFSSNNESTFNSIESDIKSKFKVISTMHNNDYDIINKNKNNYKETNFKIENMFKNINRRY